MWAGFAKNRNPCLKGRDFGGEVFGAGQSHVAVSFRFATGGDQRFNLRCGVCGGASVFQRHLQFSHPHFKITLHVQRVFLIGQRLVQLAAQDCGLLGVTFTGFTQLCAKVDNGLSKLISARLRQIAGQGGGFDIQLQVSGVVRHCGQFSFQPGHRFVGFVQLTAHFGA